MKTIKKLLLVFMISMFIPVFANAATVCKIGETEYETVDEAIAEVSDEQTILLVDDVSLPDAGGTDLYEIGADKNFTINLNSHTLTGGIENAGTLVIKGNGTLIASVTNTTTGILTLTSVQMLVAPNALSGYSDVNTYGIIRNNGVLNVNSTTLASVAYPVLYNASNSTMNITDGSITSKTIFNDGILNINSGDFTTEDNYLFRNTGTITIQDGTFSANTIAINVNLNAADQQVININGGTFTSTSTAFKNLGGNSTINITDGTIISDTTAPILVNDIIDEYAATLSTGIDVRIIITGGTINAINSSGISTILDNAATYVFTNNLIVVGSNDGTVTNLPVINIPKGYIGTEGDANETFDFFDGVINLKGEITYPESTIIPYDYNIKYDVSEDYENAYTARLVTVSEPPITDTTPTTDVSSEEASSETSTIAEDEVVNPNTGAFIASTIVVMGIIIVSAIIINKKRSKLHNI